MIVEKNNINSWANLEKKYDGNCVRSGHQLANFTKVSDAPNLYFTTGLMKKLQVLLVKKPMEQTNGPTHSLPTNHPTQFPNYTNKLSTKKPTIFPSQQNK